MEYPKGTKTATAIVPGTTMDEGSDTTFSRVNMAPGSQLYEGVRFHMAIRNGDSNVDATYHVEESTDDGSSWADATDQHGNRYEGTVSGASDDIQIDVPPQRLVGNDVRLAGDSGDKTDSTPANPDMSAIAVLLNPKEVPV